METAIKIILAFMVPGIVGCIIGIIYMLFFYKKEEDIEPSQDPRPRV